MAKPLPLPVWDRKAGRLIQEFMKDHPSTYESHPRRSLNQWLESEPLYDWLLAAYQNSARSAKQIEPFIREHAIDMSEFKPVIYRSFADFFDREFKPDARNFVSAPDEMAAFAEARYFGWEKLAPDQEFPVKGHSLSAEQVLGSAKRAAVFAGGPVLLARLSPMDYHHVHYPDDGTTLDTDWIGRSLWTVNWHALLNQPPRLVFFHGKDVDARNKCGHDGLEGSSAISLPSPPSRSGPPRQCRNQPQHATRMLTVGDPIKVKAGFAFSAAASSASSAISKARRSSPPCSGCLMVSVMVPIRLRASIAACRRGSP